MRMVNGCLASVANSSIASSCLVASTRSRSISRALYSRASPHVRKCCIVLCSWVGTGGGGRWQRGVRGRSESACAMHACRWSREDGEMRWGGARARRRRQNRARVSPHPAAMGGASSSNWSRGGVAERCGVEHVPEYLHPRDRPDAPHGNLSRLLSVARVQQLLHLLDRK